MTGAHQSSKTQKYFRARFGTCNEENAFFMKRAKMCSKAFLFFVRLMCPTRIFNKRKRVLAKALLPKAALLDWSAPGLNSRCLGKTNGSKQNILQNKKYSSHDTISMMPKVSEDEVGGVSSFHFQSTPWAARQVN